MRSDEPGWDAAGPVAGIEAAPPCSLLERARRPLALSVAAFWPLVGLWAGSTVVFVLFGAEVAFAEDEDALRSMVASRKKELAFSLGGMGSAQTNFYNGAYSRQGWAEVAAEVRERWQGGDRDGAAGLVTDEMVLGTTLIGTEPMVRERLRVWRDAGVDTVRLYPAGETLDARLGTLARAIDLVREIGSSS